MRKYAVLTLTMIICVCALFGAIGVTAAIWESGSGVSSSAPDAPVTDWNFWSKYFVYEDVRDTSNNVIGKAAVGFGGTNADTVIFPVSVGGVPVIEIRNTVFSNTDSGNARDIPVKIIVSPSIAVIAPNAFSDMANLKTVVFATGSAQKGCAVGAGVFAGCASLAEVIVEGARAVNFGKFCFAGCMGLNGFKNGSGGSYIPIGSDADAFAGSGIII